MKENYSTMKELVVYGYDALRERIKNDFQMDSSILSKLTGIAQTFIENPDVGCFQDHETDINRKKHHLAGMMAYIISGFSSSEDEYVIAHIKAMEQIFHIKRSAMAKYMAVEESALTDFVCNPEQVSAEDKYKIAVRFLSFEWMLTKNPAGGI